LKKAQQPWTPTGPRPRALSPPGDFAVAKGAVIRNARIANKTHDTLNAALGRIQARVVPMPSETDYSLHIVKTLIDLVIDVHKLSINSTSNRHVNTRHDR
jgi:hypothetical protein